jgi:hypothetical protein
MSDGSAETDIPLHRFNVVERPIADVATLNPQLTSRPSIRGLRLGGSPTAVQNLGTRAIEAYHIVPARLDRQAVSDLAVAAAELNGDGTILALLRRDVVQRIGPELVGLKISRGVVDADRPAPSQIGIGGRVNSRWLQVQDLNLRA